MTPAAPAPPAPPPWRRRLRRALYVLGFVGMLYGCRGCLLPPMGRFLDVSEPPAPVDCVLVLGGGCNTRPFAAAALVRARLAGQVLLTSVRPSPDAADGEGILEHELSRRVLLARGVPADRIVVLEGEVANTFDEAAALARHLDGHPGLSVAVLTNDFHTRRARLVFRRVLGERIDRIRFFSVPTDGYGADNWWRFQDGLETYLSEYAKLVYYSLRY